MDRILPIALALASAVCLAFGAERQGGAVRSEDSHAGLSLQKFFSFFKDPRWLLGLGLMALGTLLNISALALAPITIVQPLGATALVLTTIIHARSVGFSLTPVVKWSIFACLSGSIGFALLGVLARNKNLAVSPEQRMQVFWLTLAGVIAFVLISIVWRKRMHSFAFVLGAGVLFGFVAVQVKIVAATLTLGVPRDTRGLGEWLVESVPWFAVLGIVLGSVVGGWFVQKAYASGPPDIVIAGLTVIDPLVGVVIGMVILRELQANLPWYAGVGMGLSGLVAIVGVIALAQYHPDAHERRLERVQPGSGTN